MQQRACCTAVTSSCSYHFTAYHRGFISDVVLKKVFEGSLTESLPGLRFFMNRPDRRGCEDRLFETLLHSQDISAKSPQLTIESLPLLKKKEEKKGCSV